MKKIIAFLLLTLVIASCSTSTDGFVLKGELRGEVEDSTRVFLRTRDTLGNMVAVDTTFVTAGTFEFKGPATMPQLHYLFFDKIRGNAPIIIESGSIGFQAQKDSLAFAKLKGSEQNEIFMGYLDEQRKMSDIAKTFNQDLQKARAARDTATINSLREEYFELQEKSKAFELDFIKNNPNSLISVLILEMYTIQKTIPLEEIEEISNQFTSEMQGTESAKRIKKLIEDAKSTEIGSIAPEFSGPNPNGDLLALNDVKGKLTLIDFWAAWCKPCRMENPNVVAVYNKYKDKGLSVVGVSLDKSKEDWLKAIEADGLEWNHISNIQYFQDPIAKLYNINAIPAAFLLDENGVIVAKDLRGDALEQKVAELLN